MEVPTLSGTKRIRVAPGTELGYAQADVAKGREIRAKVALEEGAVVTLPADLTKALKAAPPAWDRWLELSYTHQREHVEAIEEAKAADTRARRIERAVKDVAARRPRKR